MTIITAQAVSDLFGLCKPRRPGMQIRGRNLRRASLGGEEVLLASGLVIAGSSPL